MAKRLNKEQKAKRLFDDLNKIIVAFYGYSATLQKDDSKDDNQYTICAELYYEEMENMIEKLDCDLEAKYGCYLEAECSGRWIIVTE